MRERDILPTWKRAFFARSFRERSRHIFSLRMKMSLNHPLVVPKKHIPDIYALDERTAAAIMVEAVIIARAVKRGLGCDGLNLVQANEPAAQQDVFHFHVHVKPRWRNDAVIFHWDTHPVSAEDLRVSMEKIQEALQ